MTNSLSQESYSKQSVAFIRSDLIEYRTTQTTKINIVYIDQDGYSSCIQSGQNLFVYQISDITNIDPEKKNSILLIKILNINSERSL